MGSVMDELDAFRANVPGCEFVVFADRNSKMVLCASSAGKHPQETYDLLSNDCVSVLAAPAITNGLAAIGQGTDQRCEAIRFSKAGPQVFLRAAATGEEALCVQCNHDVDLDAVLTHARPLLERIGEAPA